MDCKRQVVRGNDMASLLPHSSSRMDKYYRRQYLVDDNATAAPSRYQFQYQFIPPARIPPTSSSPASTSDTILGDRGSFAEQEKVSVRLDANHGLVVESGETASREGHEASGSQNPPCCSHHQCGEGEDACSVAELGSSPSRISCNKSDFSKCSQCRDGKTRGESITPPRTRHASTSGGGDPPPPHLSSLTPLMDEKHSHKIEVVISPNALKHHYNRGGTIHICCAVVFGFTASLFFSLTLLLAKMLKNRDHHPISIAFWRYLGILIPSIPLLIFYAVRGKKDKVLNAIWPIHDMVKAANALALLMRGVLGSTAVILRFCSLNFLTIADSSVISYSAPVFAALFAPFCLKDKHGFVPLLMVVVATAGVVVVSKPPIFNGSFDSETLKGVFLASLSTLCSSGILIIMRNLKKVHFSLMLFVLGVWGVFEAGVLAITLDVLKVPKLLPDIVMMTGVAVLTFFGQLFILLASLKMGQGGCVSVMRSCDIFLSFLWQYLFLRTEPEPLGVLSALLIITAVWFVLFRDWLSSPRSSESMRKRLSFILF